jgi:hypothetical protein
VVNPALNAVVQTVGPRARLEALAADQALARGELRGPLHGVPMTIKDSLDTVSFQRAAPRDGQPWCPSRTPQWWHGCALPVPSYWGRRTRRS